MSDCQYMKKVDENLKRLLDLYFDGETTLEQEETLRRRFLAGKVPPEYERYRSLFGYVAQQRTEAGMSPVRSRRRLIMGMAAAVVGTAAVLSAVGVFVFGDRMQDGAGFELTVGGEAVADEALAVEIADQGLARLHKLQAVLDCSLDSMEVRMEKSDSTVTALEEMILTKFKNK